MPLQRDVVAEIGRDVIVLGSGLKLLHVDNATLGWQRDDVVSVQGPPGQNHDELDCEQRCTLRLLAGGSVAIRGLDVYDAARFVATLLGSKTDKIVVVSNSHAALELNLRTTNEQVALGALAHAAGLVLTHTEQGYFLGPAHPTSTTPREVTVGARAEAHCFAELPVSELELAAIAYHQYGYLAALLSPPSREPARAPACILRSTYQTRIGNEDKSFAELNPSGMHFRDGKLLGFRTPPALRQWTKDDVPALVSQLKNGAEHEWREAAYTLARLGPDAVMALPTLCAIIEQPSAQSDAKLYLAHQIIERIGPNATAAIEPLRRLLTQTPQYAEQIISTIDAIGEPAVRAARVELEAILFDPSRSIDLRWSITRSFEALGRDAIPVYITLLQSTEPRIEEPLSDIRVAAGMALSELGDQGESALLDLMLHPKTPAEVRRWYTNQEEIPRGVSDLVRQRLLTALKHPDRSIRLFVVQTLADLMFQHELLFCAIERAMSDSDREVRRVARDTLAKWGPQPGLNCKAKH
jgi:hypothetical protein